MSIRPTARHSAVRSLRRGFTLIEVIAAMALMTFVIGGVYGIANGAMELGKSMSDNRVHETRITNFVTAWRDYLENLPPETRITVGEKPSRKFGRGSLLIENGTVPFAWTPMVRLAPAVEFKLERSATNRNAMNLHVLHLETKERATAGDEYEVLADLPLLENLRRFEWEFYDVEEDDWVTLWEDRPTPPLYLRLKFGFITEARDYSYVFWISGGNRVNETPSGTAPPTPPQPGGGV
jgi:prepilin-type N-terminal cleavage/methylation domain-containing protein